MSNGLEMHELEYIQMDNDYTGQNAKQALLASRIYNRGALETLKSLQASQEAQSDIVHQTLNEQRAFFLEMFARIILDDALETAKAYCGEVASPEDVLRTATQLFRENGGILFQDATALHPILVQQYEIRVVNRIPIHRVLRIAKTRLEEYVASYGLSF